MIMIHVIKKKKNTEQTLSWSEQRLLSIATDFVNYSLYVMVDKSKCNNKWID